MFVNDCGWRIVVLILEGSTTISVCTNSTIKANELLFCFYACNYKVQIFKNTGLACDIEVG